MCKLHARTHTHTHTAGIRKEDGTHSRKSTGAKETKGKTADSREELTPEDFLPEDVCPLDCTRVHKNGRLEWQRVTPILNHAKNGTPGHMLSNNGLCLCTATTIFIWFNNSNRFQIYGVACSYSSCPLLCALDLAIYWVAHLVISSC